MILPFLRQLKENNNREWFQENKGVYDTANLEFKNFIDAIIPELRSMDPSLGDINASQCLFRIYRDTRFSKNQEPYKPNFGAFMAKGGRKSIWGGYYLHLESGGSFAGGGLYMPEPGILKAVRDEIFYHPDTFLAILDHPSFKERFGKLGEEGKLKRPPRGYDPVFPAIDLLMHKHYVVGHYFQDQEVEAPGFRDEVLKTFQAMLPLNQFLNKAIDMIR